MRTSTFTSHDDVCISRHRDNAASVAANERIRNSKSAFRAAVYELGRMLGEFTSKEIAVKLDKPLNSVSGRISELKAAGLIEETAYRRDGCAVLRVPTSPQRSLF